MPLYLIRETIAPVLSTVAPVKIHEIELQASDLRSAAEAVMNRRPGPLVRGQMAFRDSGSMMDPDRYAGIADILAGDPRTLPEREPPRGNRRFIDAAQEVLDWYQEVACLRDGDDPAVCLPHLLNALIDHACATGQSFSEDLLEVARDRRDLGKTALAIDGFAFSTDLAAVADESVRHGAGALLTHTDRAGVEAEDDGVARYHLLHSLVDYCEDRGLDFPTILEQVRLDRRSMAASPSR